MSQSGCLKKFFKNKFILAAVALSILLNAAGILILKINIDFNKPLIILHYNSYLGIDRIVFDSKNIWMQVYAVSFSSLFISLLNILLAFFFFKKTLMNLKGDKISGSPGFIASMVLAGASLALQIIVLLYTVSIALVNR
jgi:hypothetical protein